MLKGCYAYKTKRMIHILRRKIGALAVHIQKAILGGRVEHRLPHRGIMGIGDIDHGQFNRDRGICHVDVGTCQIQLEKERVYEASGMGGGTN